MRHLAGLHLWAGAGGVSRPGMVGPRGGRVMSPLGDCILGDSGGGPSETCHHVVTVTLGLAWVQRGLTGWSVQVLVWWFGVHDLSQYGGGGGET